MSTKKVVSLYMEQFLAVMNGESDEVVAKKAHIQSIKALKAQVASQDADTLDFEEEVEKAAEAFKLAKVNNGVLLESRVVYCENLLNAKNKLSDKQESLDIHLDRVALYNEILAEISE